MKTRVRLEQYLSALLGLARRHRHQKYLSLSEFFQIFSEAFTADLVPFDATWQSEYDALSADQHNTQLLNTKKSSPYEVWEATLIRQIVDLREMDEVGTLANEDRHFGIDAPRGSIWFNFDPLTYLECGMAGSLGGWEPDDPTGRQLVPGIVAVINSHSDSQAVNPQDIERSIIEMPQLSWKEFTDFIECGQMYE